MNQKFYQNKIMIILNNQIFFSKKLYNKIWTINNLLKLQIKIVKLLINFKLH